MEERNKFAALENNKCEIEQNLIKLNIILNENKLEIISKENQITDLQNKINSEMQDK